MIETWSAVPRVEEFTTNPSPLSLIGMEMGVALNKEALAAHG